MPHILWRTLFGSNLVNSILFVEDPERKRDVEEGVVSHQVHSVGLAPEPIADFHSKYIKDIL